MPLGVPDAVSETIDGNTYAPFYDAYKIKFNGIMSPPYSYGGFISSTAVKYYLDKQNNELTIYGPVSSTWEVVIEDANCCQQRFQRPAHVVPIVSGTDVPLHISAYSITPASSHSATDGAINITPATSINNPNYSFSWLDSLSLDAEFATTEDVSDIQKKIYYCDMSDGNENFLCAFKLPIASGKDQTENNDFLILNEILISVNVYPNPVSDRAFVNITTNEKANAMVELYNINGQKVATIFDGES